MNFLLLHKSKTTILEQNSKKKSKLSSQKRWLFLENLTFLTMIPPYPQTFQIYDIYTTVMFVNSYLYQE